MAFEEGRLGVWGWFFWRLFGEAGGGWAEGWLAVTLWGMWA